MEVKYINPFLEAFTKTLEQFDIKDIKRGGINKKGKLYVESGVSTVICLNGGIHGNIAISMSQETAKNVFSKMMAGISVPGVDNMVLSAIGELSSMIAGTASTMLKSLDISLQISPPVVILEPSDVNPFETLAIDFDTQLGKIEFNIGFEM